MSLVRHYTRKDSIFTGYRVATGGLTSSLAENCSLISTPRGVFATGNNKYGCLGLSGYAENANVPVWTKVSGLPSDAEVMDLQCGYGISVIQVKLPTGRTTLYAAGYAGGTYINGGGTPANSFVEMQLLKITAPLNKIVQMPPVRKFSLGLNHLIVQIEDYSLLAGALTCTESYKTCPKLQPKGELYRTGLPLVVMFGLVIESRILSAMDGRPPLCLTDA